MKNLLRVLLVSILIIIPQPTFAELNYVLPYPSTMPGSIWYKAELIQEIIQKYWYFGNLSQFTYYLYYSDKYLVEAKTLFEYQQYLLGYEALKKSDFLFTNTPKLLIKAEKENKNISNKKVTLKNAALKHTEVLEELLNEIPVNIYWRPEKEKSVVLPLHKAIRQSLQIRTDI